MSKPCFFCSLDETAFFFTDKYFQARFDDFPVSPGHFIVIPKLHIERFYMLDRDAGSNLTAFIQEATRHAESKDLLAHYQSKLSHATDERMKSYMFRMTDRLCHGKYDVAGYNIGINNGQAAGQSINHLHVHVIPRCLNDEGVGLGGVRFVFPETADYAS
jgi:ATP adenylyltransferase